MSEAKRKKPVTPKKVAKSGKEGTTWKPGSSAQIIFETIKSFKNGATAQQVLKKVEGKFKSSNPKSRVNTILRAAVQRGLATKEGGKFKVARRKGDD